MKCRSRLTICVCCGWVGIGAHVYIMLTILVHLFQLFALSATEVGSLISLGPTESCEFFHDPSMKSRLATIYNHAKLLSAPSPLLSAPFLKSDVYSLEGQVKKTLTISPLNDGSGYFFNLCKFSAHSSSTFFWLKFSSETEQVFYLKDLCP